MKILVFAASLLAMTSAAMAADVGVSVNIGQPGFYGRIDIGNVPQPRVIYAQPVIVERTATRLGQQPVYLRVPPGHAKNWSRHCGKYDACGQRVYFVQDRWYTNEYAPRYRAEQARRVDSRDGYPSHHIKHAKHEKNAKHGHGNGNGNGNGKR